MVEISVVEIGCVEVAVEISVAVAAVSFFPLSIPIAVASALPVAAIVAVVAAELVVVEGVVGIQIWVVSVVSKAILIILLSQQILIG